MHDSGFDSRRLHMETILRKRGESIAVGAIAVALNRDPC